MNRIVTAGASIGIGIYCLLPALSVGLTTALFMDKKRYENAMEAYFLQLSELGRKLQKHTNDHCTKLGIRAISIIHIPSSEPLGMFSHLPMFGPVIVMGSKKHDDENELLGILNHELGHYFHNHWLQFMAVKTVIGSMCFFKKTRKLAFASFLAFKSVESSWIRFQERQADAHCIQYSTREELQGMISILSRYNHFPKPANPSFMEKLNYILFRSHPYNEDRVSQMKKALGEQHRESSN